MTIAQAIFAAGALILFVYLIMPARKPKEAPQSSRNARKNRSNQVAGMTGFMGGDIEDAMISRHALDRAKGDAGNASTRDVATSVGMQQSQPPN